MKSTLSVRIGFDFEGEIYGYSQRDIILEKLKEMGFEAITNVYAENGGGVDHILVHKTPVSQEELTRLKGSVGL